MNATQSTSTVEADDSDEAETTGFASAPGEEIAFVFHTINWEVRNSPLNPVASPRDVASGIVSPRDVASGIVSPRDAASGLPTGA